MPRGTLTSRGWFIHTQVGATVEAVSGPWPTRSEAEEQAARLADEYGVARTPLAGYAPLPEPEPGAGWFLEGFVKEGVAGIVGPFHSRRAALRLLAQIPRHEYLTFAARYHHNANGFQGTWLKRQGVLERQLEATQSELWETARTLSEVLAERGPHHPNLR